MNYDELMRDLSKREEDIRASQIGLEKELLFLGAELDSFIASTESLKKRLEDFKSAPEIKTAEERPRLSGEEFKESLERLLQGSLEQLGDKISQKILNKLKDLKGLSGPVKESKIRELKELADSEMLDFSKLFSEKVKSNIRDIGVKEKETKGIDESLKKLREMREGKDNGKDGG